jgi:hypothetical protein
MSGKTGQLIRRYSQEDDDRKQTARNKAYRFDRSS